MKTRPFKLTFDRKGKNFIGVTRYYTQLTNAIPRAMQLLLLHGQPGDVAEISNANFGFQIATIKVHVGGRFTITTVLGE